MNAPSRELHIPGFRIGEELGRGGTGRVFRARQESLNRDVALKIITTHGEKGQRRALRLFREARLAGALDHPSIVRGIDAGEGEGFCWFAMELAEGRSLQDVLEERSRLPLQLVARIGMQMLAALDHAHGRGVLHRDLKPSNILVDAEGRARLLDLGLARHEADPRLTEEGGTLGTPQYMAPEQARQGHAADARSDLFGLAATLYRALTGVGPFEGDTVSAVLTRLLYQEPDAPSKLVSGLPRAMDLVILRALQKDPTLRYRDARSFANDLRAAAMGQEPPEANAALRSSRRHRLVSVLTLSIGAALIGLLLWAGLSRRTSGSVPRKEPVPVSPAREPFSERLERIVSRRDVSLPGKLSVVTDLSNLEAPSSDPDRRLLDDARARCESSYLEGVRNAAQAFVQDVRDALPGGDPTGKRHLLLDRETFWNVLAPSRVGDVTRLPALEKESRRAVEEERIEFERWLPSFQDSMAERAKAVLENSRVAWPNEITGGPEILRRLEDLWAQERVFLALLPTESERDLRAQRDALVEELARLPLDRMNAALALAQEQAAKKQYRAARETLGTLEKGLDAAFRGNPKLQWAKEAIESAAAAEVTRLRAALRGIWRVDRPGLPVEERKRRLQGLVAAMGEVPPEPADVSGLAEVLEEARTVVRVLHGAFELRSRALVAAQSLAKKPHATFRPETRDLKPQSERRVASVDEEGIHTLKLTDDIVRVYSVDQLLAVTIGDLLRLAGESVDGRCVALLAHLDGDDLLAMELLESLPSDPFVAELRAATDRVLKRHVESFETGEEREAMAALLRARRAASKGSVALAQGELDGLRKNQRKLQGTRFWKEFKEEQQRLYEELKELQAALEEWEGFLPEFSRVDVETRSLHVRLGLRDRAAPVGLSLPRGTWPDEEGVLVPADPRGDVRPLHEIERVTLPLPPVGERRLEIRFDVLFPPPGPCSFLAVGFSDKWFLGINALKDRRPFRGRPLHGLERDVFLHRPNERGALWTGGLEDYQDVFATASTSSFQCPTGRPLTVVCVADGTSRKISVTVSGQRYELDGGRSRIPASTLSVAGWPAYRIRDLHIKVTPTGDRKR